MTILDRRIHDKFLSDNGFSLNEKTLFMACRVGSHSHGTYVPSKNNLDDTDYFLVVMPPREYLLGLESWEGWNYMEDEIDVVCYSVKKYFSLLLKSNPNVLGTLWLRDEDYLYRDWTFDGLKRSRNMFASKRVAASFSGYAHGQFTKILGSQYQGYMGAERKALFDKFGYDPKNLAHCIRLFRMGIEFLETGTMNVFRPDAEELIKIKQGALGPAEIAFPKIVEIRAALENRLRLAVVESTLPPEPCFTAINTLLIEITSDYLMDSIV